MCMIYQAWAANLNTLFSGLSIGLMAGCLIGTYLGQRPPTRGA